MRQTVVVLDVGRLLDWDSFHDVFAETFSFPANYARTMDAWQDCMQELDFIPAGEASSRVPLGHMLVLSIPDSNVLQGRNPEIYLALLEHSAYVNSCRMETGNPAYLALAFS